MLDESKKLDMEELGKVAGGRVGSEREAYDIALKHANKTKKQAKFKKSELDFEHGRQIYEVEFVAGQMEYEYEIDVETGKILKAEKELWD